MKTFQFRVMVLLVKCVIRIARTFTKDSGGLKHLVLGDVVAVANNQMRAW